MRALALTADLMLGSRLAADAAGAGMELELVGNGPALRERLAPGEGEVSVLVVDLTDSGLDGAALVAALRAEGPLARTRILGIYAHVDSAVREQALEAGFDLVVPRSRMAREGAALLTRLSA